MANIMKKLVDNMWAFVLVLLAVAMTLSAVVYFAYMRAHLIG